MLIRAGVFQVYPLINLLKNDNKVRKYTYMDGVRVKLTSQRYAVFKNSIKCCKCNIEGKFFAAEKDDSHNTDNYHLNLYAINSDGDEVMMTKDHIIPKSKGGKNHLSNYQTMCVKCNESKADKQ